MDTTNLNVVLVSNLLEFGHLSSEFRQSDVNGSAEGCTKIGWARGDVTKVLIVSETSDSLNMSCSFGKAGKHSSDISSILHRNDSKLIFFIDPHKEGLVIVMEDSSSSWPISIESTGFEEPISFLEQEMILNQLLLVLRCHSCKRVVLALEFTLEF